MVDKKAGDSGFGRGKGTFSRLRGLHDQGFVMVVTKAFGPDGEDLIDRSGHLFSGEAGVRIKVRQGDLEEDVVLSPFYGDPSKINEQPFEEGEPVELFTPSGVPLDAIPGLETNEGGSYFAVYLTEKLDGGEIIAINNIWGNTESHFLDEGQMLKELAEREMASAGH